MADTSYVTMEWQDPVAFAATLTASGETFVFLHSGMQTSYSGRYSYLAWGEQETIASEDFALLEQAMGESNHTELPTWFGYLGYELGQALEKSPPGTASATTPFPPLYACRFRHILRFDHDRKEMLYQGDAPTRDTLCEPPAPTPIPPVAELYSNMTKAQYLASVSQTVERIHAGDFYQANITRKFGGTFADTPDGFAIFRALLHASPAPYAAYFRTPYGDIISSSPELFLRVDSNGMAETRPIKGTLGRDKTSANLKESAKDRAENLMIVDLMRNDFSRACEPGSVNVETLCDVDSFATLHHMASTIQGKLQNAKTPLDLTKACFPPGSMTGAPKIAAMQWCAAQENAPRGVYSGALGWITPKTCEFSVVIRTLLLWGNRFEFQVGGGIVADSDPHTEWRETLTKALGIAKVLGIEDRLERL